MSANKLESASPQIFTRPAGLLEPTWPEPINWGLLVTFRFNFHKNGWHLLTDLSSWDQCTSGEPGHRASGGCQRNTAVSVLTERECRTENGCTGRFGEACGKPPHPRGVAQIISLKNPWGGPASPSSPTYRPTLLIKSDSHCAFFSSPTYPVFLLSFLHSLHLHITNSAINSTFFNFFPLKFR